jgi:hypothetical protein
MSHKNIKIKLKGDSESLSFLFSFPKELEGTNLTTLEMFISRSINQTLMRDGCFGAWAEVPRSDGDYEIKISGPHHDLHPYKKLIKDFVKAGKEAVKIYRENQEKIREIGEKSGNPIRFVLPFGLSMARARSIQLLHFPPMEAYVYYDYLFSPSNRRWENLLGYNGMKGGNFAELESIVDCVPLAAPGGDNQDIDVFNNTFTPYVKKMLRARLIPHKGVTQPIVAYGGPVHRWLEQAFPDQIGEKLYTLSLVELRLFDDKVVTPVLCANHPSMYFYDIKDTSGKPLEQKIEILTQDLIAAGWQMQMANNPRGSAKNTLEAMTSYWTGNPEVKRVMKQEDKEFGF